MSPDDIRFERLYRSLPSRLIVAACTMDCANPERLCSSFCRSLKNTAIRLGSDALHFWWPYSPKNWKTKGIEHFQAFIDKHKGNGVRLFFVNHPIDTSVDFEAAALIDKACRETDVATIVTTTAGDIHRGKFLEQSLAVTDRKHVRFRVGSACIVLEHEREGDDWYAAMFVYGGKQTSCGPFSFVSESAHENN